MQRTTIRVLAPAVLAALSVFAASDLNGTLQAQTTTPQVIASGLDNPRGLAFGPGGLYVVEAGRGGTSTMCLPPVGPAGPRCYGATGAITQISGIGVHQRVLAGLPSVALAGGNEAEGPHDIEFGFNSALITVGPGADPALRAPFEAAGISLQRLLRVEFTGQMSNPFDLGTFEAANNSDGGMPDSNPYGLRILSNRGLVADAGANALLELGLSGLSTLAVFPSRMVPNPMGGPDIPMQAVPTSVVQGPDGSLYVGELTGFPFPVGRARVYRMPAAGGTPTVVAEGFTNIIDLAIGPDGSAYVLEHDANGLLQAGTTGRLTKIGLFGARTEIAAGALDTPGGMTFGPDAALYVTTHSSTAGAGQVVRIAQP